MTEPDNAQAGRLPKMIVRLRDRGLLIPIVWAGLIFIVALVARSIWVAYAPSDPTDGRVFNDTLFYYYSATDLAHGHGYVMPVVHTATTFWPPGYSFLLAGLFRVFGEHVAIAWGANIVLGALTCVVLYLTARLALGEKAAIATGLMLAVFPGHVFFSSLVLSEVTFTFFVAMATLLILLVARRREKPGVLLAALLGIAIGAAALVRGQGLFLIPIAMVFWLAYRAGWKRTLQHTALTTMATAMVILPWTVRNYVQTGGFVLISSNVGSNLYIGNNELATGRVVMGIDTWAKARYSYLPAAEQEVATGNLLLREGLKFMFTHPGKEAQLAGSKIRALYQDDEEALRGIPNHQTGETIAHAGGIADVANGFYLAALALSGVGLLAWLRRPRGALALPILVVVVFTMGQLLFFTDPRFHYPMLPAIALMAAAGLSALAEWATLMWRRRSPGEAAAERRNEEVAG